MGQNTLSVTNVPDNVPTIVVLAKGTDNETVFTVTGKTSNSLTGVARIRGANVNLDATTPVTILNNAEFINQYSTAVFSPDTLTPLLYAEDGGSTDAYAISLDPAPSSYNDVGLIVFKANTTNTGAASLNVNSLGAKTIKKNVNEDLADGDIQSGQIVAVVYDGTNFQLIGSGGFAFTGTPAQGSILFYGGSEWELLAAGTAGQLLKTQGSGADPIWSTPDGWIQSAVTWTRTGDHSFTVPGDLTAIFSPGTRVKYTDTGGTDYGVVASSSHAGGTTTVNLAPNTDYAMASGAISGTFYSYDANPQGYPGWFNYAETWSGFSSAPSGGHAMFSVNGRVCHLNISRTSHGTSNSTSSAVTVPIAPAVTQSGVPSGSVVDNGTTGTNIGVINFTASNTTANLYDTPDQGGWTASGQKNSFISVFYQI